MARARKSHIGDEEKIKPRRGGIEPAYGSRVGDNIYVVYADLRREHDDHSRILVLNFAARYAAKFFISKLIHNDTWEKCNPIGSRTGIITSSGVRITMFNDEIWPILDHELTEAEAEWRDDLVEKYVMSFKYGRGDSVKEETPPPTVEGEGVPQPRKEKPAKTPKPEPKPKVDTSGHVSANDLAKQFGVEGREVRAVLRSLKLEKPAHGWSWPKDEADKIKAQVEKGLKEAKKGKKK